ncbi:MAG: hypothetical protein R3D89_12310 [Sphingomonadaceae bacterium]
MKFAIAALAVPVLGGIAGLAALGAPTSYLITNLAALVLAGVWVALGRAPASLKAQRILTVALLALLFAPLLTGPEQQGIARWLPLGPFTLHAGMLAFPSLAVLAARDPDYAAPILLTALLAAFLQPDAATGFAVVFAAVGLHDVSKDWKFGLVAIVGFVAAILMALRGLLPAVPFVERVLIYAARDSFSVALGMALALAIGFTLLIFRAPLPRAERYALAGALFGFIVMALISHYPTPLVGYGAAPILGFGLALGLRRAP